MKKNKKKMLHQNEKKRNTKLTNDLPLIPN